MVAGLLSPGGYNLSIYMKESSCKKCRRAGQKLFLKGERCFTSKCAIVKKPYPPGLHGKKRRRNVSEYGAQLAEKQKLCRIYNIREEQFKRYLKKSSKEKGVIGDNLLRHLEMRLDNTVFRLGWAESRKKARQLVNHGHILVNGKKVDIPSFELSANDTITIKKSSISLAPFKNLNAKFKKYKAPEWLSSNLSKLEGKVKSLPKQEDAAVPVDIQMVVEYYSR